MSLLKHKHFNLTIHILSWSIIILFPYPISSASDQYKIGPHPGLYFTLSGIVHCVMFYLNSLILFPKLFNKTYWPFYTVCSLLLIYLSYELKIILLETWFPDALKNMVLWHVFFSSVIAFVASVFYSVTIEKARAEKLQKENEAMQLAMELALLRSQINPHFLFNTLTNLVYMARKKSEHLETSLLMLANLMRYMFYDGANKIALQHEIEYLDSYVKLQKLRFEQDVNVLCNIDFPNEGTTYTIEPMLLIPFAENAFKHGSSYVDHPTIEIKLTVEGGVLTYRVRNKFDKASVVSKQEPSGIGLNNVRSRLNLLYPGKHNLVIRNDDRLFDVDLTIKL